MHGIVKFKRYKYAQQIPLAIIRKNALPVIISLQFVKINILLFKQLCKFMKAAVERKRSVEDLF